MGNKRAFIVGAGFSKQAGMPLAKELTGLILNRKRLTRVMSMRTWVNGFRRRLAAVEGAGADVSLNIEQFFDFAKYDEELWRMKQQLAPVGREYGDTPWNKADGISAWLSYMEEELSRVLWDAQKEANLEPIKRFTCQLSSDDTALTFNYDTLLETALAEQGQAWNHGLDDRANGGVTILKMHGSIDWILRERKPGAPPENFVKLFSKRDTNVEEHGHQAPDEEEYASELWRAKDETTCNRVINSPSRNFQLGLAGLGQYKPLHRLPGSAWTWLTAFNALTKAKEIYAVGFSMSPYDSMTRFHFTSVISRRCNPPRRVVIIDPNAKRMADAYSTVFGKDLTLMTLKAEDMDWHKTLGR